MTETVNLTNVEFLKKIYLAVSKLFADIFKYTRMFTKVL